jgi:molecular chaperone DnaK
VPLKIGIDFGTTYTKIAYLDAAGALNLFRFPGETGAPYIPTAVAYRERQKRQIVSVGHTARSDFFNSSDLKVYCENFKLFLHLLPEEWNKNGWTCTNTPEEITRSYFSTLLRLHEHSFERMHYNIESMVVSVPQLWQEVSNNPGCNALQNILFTKLALPLHHLQSEPVCAAAYYAHRHQERQPTHRPYHILVCDVGGGTFDVALCEVMGQRVEVKFFGGNGQGGFGQAGVCFDKNAVRLAYRRKNGRDPDETGPEFTELVRAFEQIKIDKTVEIRILINALKDSEFLDEEEIFTFAKHYSVNLKLLQEAFLPIKRGIFAVLDDIQRKAAVQGRSIDRLEIVGGFGQFPLTQMAILEGLGLQDPTKLCFDPSARNFDRFYAIAYGAALVANELIQPVECFPHEVGYEVHRYGSKDVEEPVYEIVPVAKANTVLAGQVMPTYACYPDGTRRTVLVLEKHDEPMMFYLRNFGNGPWEPRNLPGDYPEPGKYYIGLLVDRSNLCKLLFEPTGETTGVRKVYPLGVLKAGNKDQKS